MISWPSSPACSQSCSLAPTRYAGVSGKLASAADDPACASPPGPHRVQREDAVAWSRPARFRPASAPAQRHRAPPIPRRSAASSRRHCVETKTPPKLLSFTTPAKIRAGFFRSTSSASTLRPENPSFEAIKARPPSVLASTPPRSVANSTWFESRGSTKTSFTITSGSGHALEVPAAVHGLVESFGGSGVNHFAIRRVLLQYPRPARCRGNSLESCGTARPRSRSCRFRCMRWRKTMLGLIGIDDDGEHIGVVDDASLDVLPVLAAVGGLPGQMPCAGVDHVRVRRINGQRLDLMNFPAARRADLGPCCAAIAAAEDAFERSRKQDSGVRRCLHECANRLPAQPLDFAPAPPAVVADPQSASRLVQPSSRPHKRSRDSRRPPRCGRQSGRPRNPISKAGARMIRHPAIRRSSYRWCQGKDGWADREPRQRRARRRLKGQLRPRAHWPSIPAPAMSPRQAK